MPDTTAWMLVGPESSGFGSDYFSPTHLLTLSENERAAWTLISLAESPLPKVAWVPASPDTFVHDAMLLTAIHVFEDEQILEIASRVIPDVKGQRVDLIALDRPSELTPLYERCRAVTWKCSLAVTALSQSSLRSLLGAFAQYPFDVRICVES